MYIFLSLAEKALATLQSRPIPGLQPPVPLVLSPYPPTIPPTPMPPPSAIPRLVKHLPPGFTDSQLYDIFRPYGALASARTQAGFGNDTGVVEFWREEDAVRAEEAMHCSDVDGSSIAVQVYQQRRTSGVPEFSVNAPAFVPSGSMYSYPTQVRHLTCAFELFPQELYSTRHLAPLLILHGSRYRLFMDQVSKYSWHHSPDLGRIAIAD